MSSSKDDVGKKVASKGTLLYSECFGYKVSREDLFRTFDNYNLSAKMPALSSHDDRVMYVPTSSLYPSSLEDNLFFKTADNGIDGVDTYKFNSLHLYAVVIAANSLGPEYAAIYNSVYPNQNVMETVEGAKRSIRRRCKENDEISAAAYDCSIVNKIPVPT